MYFVGVFCLVVSISAIKAKALPQSASDLAAGVKYAEQTYYNIEAPDVLPYDNSQDSNAREEQEGYGSRIDSVYDGLHKKSQQVFNPKPVFDGIKEGEKYGNKGDQLSGVKNAVTSVMSVVSNFVNALVDAPANIVTSVITGANVVLNKIGGKVVGLQK